MKHIIWDYNKDAFLPNDYTRLVFSFNDSDLWLAYNYKVNFNSLRDIIRNWKKKYPVVRVKIMLLSEHLSFDYYVRSFGNEKKIPTIHYCSIEEAKHQKPEYRIITKSLLSKMFFLNQPDTQKPRPRREVKHANRERILLTASMSIQRTITDEEWAELRSVIPVARTGRRPQYDRRAINAIIWMLSTGALWEDIPSDLFGPWKSTHNRFHQWKANGVIYEIAHILDINVTPLLKKRYY